METKKELPFETKSARQSLIDERDAIIESFINLIRKEIGFDSTNWKIQYESHRLTFELLDKNGSSIFGKFFTVYFDYDWYSNDKSNFDVNINFGGFGGFDPIKEPENLILVQSVSRMATVCANISFRDILKQFTEKLASNREAIRTLSK